MIIHYKSDCCGASTSKLDEVAEIPHAGGASYYYHTCDKCERLCRRVIRAAFDCEGKMINSGDIVEDVEAPEDIAWKYYICFEVTPYQKNKVSHLEFRDLGANNIGTPNLPCRNIGHYSGHPDKFDEEDENWYFGDRSFS